MNSSKSIIVISKKKEKVSFDCICTEKISGEFEIPKPDPNGDNYTTGMGVDDFDIECPACKKKYRVIIEVDPNGYNGIVTVEPPVNNLQVD